MGGVVRTAVRAYWMSDAARNAGGLNALAPILGLDVSTAATSNTRAVGSAWVTAVGLQSSPDCGDDASSACTCCTCFCCSCGCGRAAARGVVTIAFGDDSDAALTSAGFAAGALWAAAPCARGGKAGGWWSVPASSALRGETGAFSRALAREDAVGAARRDNNCNPRRHGQNRAQANCPHGQGGQGGNVHLSCGYLL